MKRKERFIDLKVGGMCTHVRTAQEQNFDADMPNRRQLTGMERHAAGDVINTIATSATGMLYRKLGRLKEDKVAARNVTACQTPSIFRQAAYKRRMSETRCPNGVLELDPAYECRQLSVVGPSIPGYNTYSNWDCSVYI